MTIILKLINGILEYSGPFLIREIIDYATNEEREVTKGILLVAGIILSRVILALLNCRTEILLVKPLNRIYLMYINRHYSVFAHRMLLMDLYIKRR